MVMVIVVNSNSWWHIKLTSNLGLQKEKEKKIDENRKK